MPAAQGASPVSSQAAATHGTPPAAPQPGTHTEQAASPQAAARGQAAPQAPEKPAAAPEPAVASAEQAQAAAPAASEAETPAEPAKAAAPAEAHKSPPPPVRTARQEPMPEIDPNSPARMLNPPINIHRSQFDLEGVGNAVTVRRVSQAAQDTVGSAYNALIRGEYDTALGFYDQALKQEPTSVLALLGRGAALQKLGRKDEARQSYEQVLKVSPANREALTNLTALEGERAPGEALARLLDLEKQYPNFSPVKAQIGLIYARLENFDGALEYFQRALVVTPDAPLYLYNMALVLDRLGRGKQAVVYYERVLNLLSGGRSIPELSVPDIQRRVTYLRSK
jgi:tetratricopeptide (TPR) repeat protein